MDILIIIFAFAVGIVCGHASATYPNSKTKPQFKRLESANAWITYARAWGANRADQLLYPGLAEIEKRMNDDK